MNALIKKYAIKLFPFLEECISITIFFLRILFRLKFLKDWKYSGVEQHFYDQRQNVVDSFLNTSIKGSYPFLRAFYASEVIMHGDIVLDIGFGDGFFTNRFYATKVEKIDAVDIEQSALDHAQKHYSTNKINFFKRNAITDMFPSDTYDVIIFDGALGHISHSDSLLLLDKIKCSLSKNGIFIGSESLGTEGHDHLQFFENVTMVKQLLYNYFDYVSVKEIEYPLDEKFIRKECYWRASNSQKRFNEIAWSDIK